MNAQGLNRRGFTLVELLVVIAIIALLLAVLLPAVGKVKTNAKIAQTTSYYNGISTGIESYRAEQSLGASLPPSISDAPSDKTGKIASPFAETVAEIDVSGAQLLVMALMGADGLGTPGFKATVTPSDGWWNDTFKGPIGDCKGQGLYCIKTDGKEGTVRYGPYADQKLQERVKSIKQLGEKGRILNPDSAGTSARVDLGFFTDAWDLPILYYKASPGSNFIVSGQSGQNTQKGIYRQEDNALITGSTTRSELKGLDFGAGGLGQEVLPTGAYHYLADAAAPATSDANDFLAETKITFARYIVDSKIKARITPVLKDSYLLISAGPDAIYGTGDDITNWTRETQ